MTNKKCIIGVVGLIGSGKDTVADYLANFHNFRRESFASSLKDAISVIFGWDRVLLEGRTKQSREWREQIDGWWSERLQMPNLTPRWILQYWGTDVCRKSFHDDIWIASLAHKLSTSADNIVISDCRFPNEFKAIHEAGGILIKVVRGDAPVWVNDAIIATSSLSADEVIAATTRLSKLGIHHSEWAWVGLTVDTVIYNNGTIDELYNQVATIVG